MLLALATALGASAYGCAQVIGIEDTKVEQQSVADAGAPLGKEWACENTPAPTPTKSSITITVSALTVTTGKALEGMTLGECPILSTCNAPTNTAVTDANGNATLTVSLPSGSKGFFGPLKFEAKDHETLFWYFAHPKTDD